MHLRQKLANVLLYFLQQQPTLPATPRSYLPTRMHLAGYGPRPRGEEERVVEDLEEVLEVHHHHAVVRA